MQISSSRICKLFLLATTLGVVGASDVQAQIGLGQPVATVPSSAATVYDDGSPQPTYGTSAQTVHVLQSFAFIPFSGASDDVDSNGFASRFCTSAGCLLEAPLMLPAGALIEGIALEACDTNPGGLVQAELFPIAGLELEQPGALVTVGTGQVETPDCGFFPVFLPAPHTVDNVANSYVVQIGLTGGDETTRFQAVRVFYRLQLSPPPGTATFNDVPTDHPLFPFIEAFVASGITGGCGNDDYCPNAPLTRGQMAVFLATALGLHWAP